MTTTAISPAPRRSVTTADPIPRRRVSPADALPIGALGLALIAASFYLNRTGHATATDTAIFWAGFVVLLTPFAVHVLAERTPPGHRLGLVVAFGLLSYAIKVLHDPLTFGMGDEFLHVAAALRLAAHPALGQVFSDQGINVAVDYPGLQLLTVAVERATGLSLFVSGLITIAAARTMMILAVFALARRVSGSARVAGVAALLFCANGNFLLWSAQFSYQSLALPLFVVCLALLTQPRDSAASRSATTASLAIIAGAIVITHHLTSLALIVVLWFFSLCALRPRWRAYRRVVLAGLMTAAAIAWLLLEAPETRPYLGYILTRTLSGVGQALNGGGRTPFQSNSYNSTRWPLPEELVSYLAFALVAVGTLAALWRRRRLTSIASPVHLLLVLASPVFIALYALRLDTSSWETANRGQEFIFVAPAVLIAIALVEATGAVRARRALNGALVVALVIAICGGVVQGWESRLLLPPPLSVRVDGATIRSQSPEAAQWATTHLGTAPQYLADAVSGRELVARGAPRVLMGSTSDVNDVLHSATLPAWQIAYLRANHASFVVLDRRRISTDPEAGYYFATRSQPSGGQGYYPAAAQLKFPAEPNVSTVFDSGDIVIYDVRGLDGEPPRPPTGGAGVRTTWHHLHAGRTPRLTARRRFPRPVQRSSAIPTRGSRRRSSGRRLTPTAASAGARGRAAPRPHTPRRSAPRVAGMPPWRGYAGSPSRRRTG